MSFDMIFSENETNRLGNKNDVKLLICYILSNVSAGFSQSDILEMLQENNFANYFEASDAFSDLLASRHIFCIDSSAGIYTVTDSGRMIASQLYISLPAAAREHAMSAAASVLDKRKLERENKVQIKKTSHGYAVNCNISGGDVDLLSLNIYVPDLPQANMVKRNFHKNPELIYHSLLALLTNDKNFAAKALQELED